MKTDILAIGAHPDDVEISACGILLKEIAFGKKAAVVDLTRGELGTRGSADERDKEAQRASQMMGLLHRSNLGLKDGFFMPDEASTLKLVERIRFYQPEVVLIPAPRDRHPDHGRASALCSDACFLSALPKVRTSSSDVDQQTWKPKTVYHYIQDWHLDPDFVVDITDFAERKIEILKAYKSQFFDPSSTEPVTPISKEDFFDFLRGRWAGFGRLVGTRYAEGFISQRAIGVHHLTDIY